MKYEAIIDLPRPASNHPKMTAHDRAAQFSPFAALTGYEDAIRKTQQAFDLDSTPEDSENHKKQ